ncbi:MAG: nucleotide-binding universal stress UspA family protein [Arenicella sp.]
MYKNIIVCVNETDGRDNAIRAAVQLAKKINATLTGVYVKEISLLSGGAYGMSSYGMGSSDMIELIEKRDAEKSSKANRDFQEIVDDLDYKATWLEVSAQEHPLRAMAYSDLIITNQVAYDPAQGHSNIGFINTLVLETGKPVILIPTQWDEVEFGKRIVIGWDESREAIRAVQDAMPILKQAEQVDTVAVNHKKSDNEVVDISEISSYLSRHGVANGFHLKETDEKANQPEKVLRKFAKKTAADLIVVGGYGHTRLREIILGGTTRHLCKHSTVPVLFSH